MAKKSIRLNYFYNTLYQVFTLLTPLITAPYLSRVLGAAGIGTVSYAESVVSYFTIFVSLGTSTYGQREVAYAQEDMARRSKIFWEIKILNAVTGLLILAFYLPFALLQDNWGIYLILTANLLSVIFDVSWFYQGLENFGAVALRNILYKSVSVVFVFVFVKDAGDLILYVAGNSVVYFAATLAMWGRILRHLSRPNFKELRPFRHLPTLISLFIPTLAVQIYTVLDKTMIGLMTSSPEENGYYEQATKLSRMVLTLITSLGTVMTPRIGYLFEKGDCFGIRRYLARSFRFVWLLGIPLALGLFSISTEFVPWFYGEGYDAVIPLLRVLAFLIPVIGISNICSAQFFIPTKKQNLLTVTVVSGAGLNFLLNLILIPQYRALGAAVASVAAELFVAAFQLYLMRREWSPSSFFKSGIRYFVSGLLMAGFIRLLARLPVPDGVFTLLAIVVGALAYFLCLLLMRDSFLTENVRKIFHMLVKRNRA
ncbi:MAG: flippase [Clostridia bacterium]|nr:flippase [Clostridia bacterium]